MSSLEEKAQPILIRILDGSLPIEALTREQQHILARWVGETAVVESHAVPADHPVPATLLGWMRAHEEDAPGRFGVAVAKTELNIVGHLQVGMIHDLIGGGISAGNIVVLALPNIALACAFPVPELTRGYDLRCDLAVYKPLWPSAASWTQMQDLPPSIAPAPARAVIIDLASRIEIFHTMV